MAPATDLRKAKKPVDTSHRGFSCKTILFNCECHSFDEVERQLVKAIHCTMTSARALALEVHTTGSAVVYTGHKERCEAVAGVLEDIKLIVKVSE